MSIQSWQVKVTCWVSYQIAEQNRKDRIRMFQENLAKFKDNHMAHG